MTNLMNMMGDWQAVHVDGRKQPLYYRSVGDWPNTIVLGHYNSPCGGCDTIGSARAVYDLILKIMLEEPKPVNIICEGLLLSEDVKWTSKLNESFNNSVTVYFLTTPVEKCLEQIKGRREKAGNDKPLDPKNTVNRTTTIERARMKLGEAGVYTRRCSANQATDLVLSKLRLHAQTGE